MAFYSFTTPRLQFSQPIQDTSSQNAGFWQSGTRMKKSARPQKYNNNKHILTLVVFYIFSPFFYIHISKFTVNVSICRMFKRLFVESYCLYDCKPAPSVLWVCACSRVFMAGSVALERRIAVSLEGPISQFVFQDEIDAERYKNLMLRCPFQVHLPVSACHMTDILLQTGPRPRLRPQRVSLFRWHDCCSWRMSSW